MNQVLYLLFIFTSTLLIHIILLNNRLKAKFFGGFNYCDDSTYPILLKKFVFDPNPIIIGKAFNLTINGSNSKVIKQGSFASISLNDTVVHFDFCKELNVKCPINPGNFNFNLTRVIPTDFKDPENYIYTFNMQVTGIEF